MKANDNIRGDEMALAAALAAMHASGLSWTSGNLFTDGDGRPCDPTDETVEACCAVGALQIAGLVTRRAAEELNATAGVSEHGKYAKVIAGNDDETTDPWSYENGDRGESLGYAFRCAMGRSR